MPKKLNISKLDIPELNNPEWLRSQYETLSMESIAKSLGVSRGSVRNRLIAFGIERRDKIEEIRKIGKRPKGDEQRKKMSESASDRWKNSPMMDETRMKISRNRKRGGDKYSKYKRVFDIEYGAIHEHRLIMIQKLGRPLKPNEHVHHIDGNPENNSIENLIVLTNAQHAKLHNSARDKDEFGRFT